MTKVLTILIASLILFLNLGFTINSHYCSGNLYSSSLTIGHGDIGCGMEGEESLCEKVSYDDSFKKKDCCKNQNMQFEIDEDYNKSIIGNLNIDFKFVASIIISFAMS